MALFAAADGGSEGLFVKLSSVHSKEWWLLRKVEHRAGSGRLGMGISLEKAGAHPTACASHGRSCQPGQPAEFVMTNPGVAYFDFQGARSLFSWDAKPRELKLVWTSD